MCTVPTSSFSAISNANGKFFVNTADCSPYSDLFAISIASSTEFILIIGNTGPNGSSQAILISVVTLSKTTGHIKFFSLFTVVNAFAPFSCASFINPSIKSADGVSITVVISALSKGSPTVNFSTSAFIKLANLSATESITSTLLIAVHLCPE